MKKIAVRLTLEELQTLVTMADNQLFRIRFIDSKLPGHVGSPEALRQAQAAVQVLQNALKEAKGFPTKTAAGAD
jgi:hypothetical protein